MSPELKRKASNMNITTKQLEGVGQTISLEVELEGIRTVMGALYRLAGNLPEGSDKWLVEMAGELLEAVLIDHDWSATHKVMDDKRKLIDHVVYEHFSAIESAAKLEKEWAEKDEQLPESSFYEDCW